MKKRPTYSTDRHMTSPSIPLPYNWEAPPPDDSTLVATQALFQVAQDALTEFFATLPKNLRGGVATAEEDTPTPT